jgi:hypothetical protein
MASTVPEVVALVLQTVRLALIKITALNVYLYMASTSLPEIVVDALQTVWLALIKIIAPNVHLHMGPTVPEVVAGVLQTV